MLGKGQWSWVFSQGRKNPTERQDKTLQALHYSISLGSCSCWFSLHNPGHSVVSLWNCELDLGWNSLLPCSLCAPLQAAAKSGGNLWTGWSGHVFMGLGKPIFMTQILLHCLVLCFFPWHKKGNFEFSMVSSPLALLVERDEFLPGFWNPDQLPWYSA